jgi:hypothetical protein
MTTASAKIQIARDTESIWRYTTQKPGSAVDHYNAFRDMLDEMIDKPVRKRTLIGPGDWYIGTPLVLEPDGAETSIRNFQLAGSGGNNTQPGTRLYFSTANTAVAGFTVKSGYDILLEHMTLRCTNAIQAIMHITAGNSPALSGTTLALKFVNFAPLGATSPTHASLKVDNVKLFSAEDCWFTNGNTEDATGIRMGGSEADFPSTLQQGVVHNATIKRCFIFNRLSVRNVKQMDVSDTVFAEAEYSIIEPAGDKRWQAGSVRRCGFFGDSAQTAITLGDYDPGTQFGEDAGQIILEGNEFRDRAVSINVGALGRCKIVGNEFFVRRPGDIGIVIPSTATDVYIDPLNNFEQAYRNGNVAVQDDRISTSKMTNMGQHLLASAHLEADVAPVGVGFERVINCNGLNFRGGPARIDYHVAARNGATGAQDIRIKVQQTLNDGTIIALPISSQQSIPASSEATISGTATVFLTPDTTFEDSTCSISLWVQWEGNTDAFLRGAADSNTSGHTWLQAEWR